MSDDRSADWGAGEPVTARQFRYQMNSLYASLALVFSLLFILTGIILINMGGYKSSIYSIALVSLGAYLMIVHNAITYDGKWRRLLGKIQDLPDYPLSEMEPEVSDE